MDDSIFTDDEYAQMETYSRSHPEMSDDDILNRALAAKKRLQVKAPAAPTEEPPPLPRPGPPPGATAVPVKPTGGTSLPYGGEPAGTARLGPVGLAKQRAAGIEEPTSGWMSALGHMASQAARGAAAGTAEVLGAGLRAVGATGLARQAKDESLLILPEEPGGTRERFRKAIEPIRTLPERFGRGFVEPGEEQDNPFLRAGRAVYRTVASVPETPMHAAAALASPLGAAVQKAGVTVGPYTPEEVADAVQTAAGIGAGGYGFMKGLKALPSALAQPVAIGAGAGMLASGAGGSAQELAKTEGPFNILERRLRPGSPETPPARLIELGAELALGSMIKRPLEAMGREAARPVELPAVAPELGAVLQNPFEHTPPKQAPAPEAKPRVLIVTAQPKPGESARAAKWRMIRERYNAPETNEIPIGAIERKMMETQSERNLAKWRQGIESLKAPEAKQTPIQPIEDWIETEEGIGRDITAGESEGLGTARVSRAAKAGERLLEEAIRASEQQPEGGAPEEMAMPDVDRAAPEIQPKAAESAGSAETVQPEAAMARKPRRESPESVAKSTIYLSPEELKDAGMSDRQIAQYRKDFALLKAALRKGDRKTASDIAKRLLPTIDALALRKGTPPAVEQPGPRSITAGSTEGPEAALNHYHYLLNDETALKPGQRAWLQQQVEMARSIQKNAAKVSGEAQQALQKQFAKTVQAIDEAARQLGIQAPKPPAPIPKKKGGPQS